jgi:ADP-heptose:LPS heptosyltransferase
LVIDLKEYVITLDGGVGNVIQTIPFMLWLKSNGYQVYARMGYDVFSKEICEIASDSYHHLIEHDDRIPLNSVYKGNIMASEEGKKLVKQMPEWQAWFRFHGFEIPSKPQFALNIQKRESPSRVIIAPCCKPNWQMKRYPHWNELIAKIPRCTVVGLPSDGDNLKGDFIDLRGKTSLSELGGILQDADYVIAEEGGVAHLSCAVGTKTYILYGGTDPVKNSTPANSIQIMSSQPFACRPCQTKGWYTEGTGLNTKFYGCKKSEMIDGYSKCMMALSSFEVLKAIADNGN